MSSLARELTHSVLKSGARAGQRPADAKTLIEAWQAQREFKLARCHQLLADLKPVATLDMAMLSVLLRELRALV